MTGRGHLRPGQGARPRTLHVREHPARSLDDLPPGTRVRVRPGLHEGQRFGDGVTGTVRNHEESGGGVVVVFDEAIPRPVYRTELEIQKQKPTGQRMQRGRTFWPRQLVVREGEDAVPDAVA